VDLARAPSAADRRFTLSAEDIARINPDTKTAPVFRSRADAELTAKIYARVPVFIDETATAEGNPWGGKSKPRLRGDDLDLDLFAHAHVKNRPRREFLPTQEF
jgi:hypothetical protein